MNDLLTRKKHSKRIAKLALKKCLIDKEFYDDLYLESYNIQRNTKRKNKCGCRFGRYYVELYYGTSDYWGECDEYNLVDYITEIIYWTLSEINEFGIIIKPYTKVSTLQIIRFLSSLNDWKTLENQHKENIESMI